MSERGHTLVKRKADVEGGEGGIEVARGRAKRRIVCSRHERHGGWPGNAALSTNLGVQLAVVPLARAMVGQSSLWERMLHAAHRRRGDLQLYQSAQWRIVQEVARDGSRLGECWHLLLDWPASAEGRVVAFHSDAAYEAPEDRAL